jgi:hypothetical protein
MESAWPPPWLRHSSQPSILIGSFSSAFVAPSSTTQIRRKIARVQSSRRTRSSSQRPLFDSIHRSIAARKSE